MNQSDKENIAYYLKKAKIINDMLDKPENHPSFNQEKMKGLRSWLVDTVTEIRQGNNAGDFVTESYRKFN